MTEKKWDDKGLFLFVKSKALVSLEDMLNGISYLENDKNLPRDLRILEDASQVEVSFNISDLTLIAEKMKEAAQAYNSIKHAVIHDSPKNTAFAYIVENKQDASNYFLSVFSTEKAALEWLNSYTN